MGDAVLELVTTKYLYHLFPSEQEGVLTSYRSALVKTTTLAEVARDLGLGQKLFMSHGEEATGGRENEGLLADALEAVIGAIYLDQGLDVVEVFLDQHLFPKFEEIKQKRLYKDSKSLLQEEVQARGLTTPTYNVVKEVGPDHEKEFTVEVIIDGQVAGLGTGKSKQAAQQVAAAKALEKYEN